RPEQEPAGCASAAVLHDPALANGVAALTDPVTKPAEGVVEVDHIGFAVGQAQAGDGLGIELPLMVLGEHRGSNRVLPGDSSWQERSDENARFIGGEQAV